MNTIKLLFSLLTVLLVFVIDGHPQEDSTSSDKTELNFKPKFSGFQLEATSMLLVNEAGGLVDFDFYSTSDNYQNLGTRLSVEHYAIMPFGAVEDPGNEPVTNYNIYARHTIKGEDFWFSFLLGGTLQSNALGSFSDARFSPRVGVEIKYNITDYEIGLIFKGAKSFVEEIGFLGVGISVGFFTH